MTQKIHVLVADDHAVVREGLRALINGKSDMELIGEAADGDEAITQARSLQPDVILMDVIMPRKDGIQAIREIRRENSQARIMVLTSFGDENKILSAIRAGALGYLLKDSSPQELVEAIRCVFRGDASLQPAIAKKLILKFDESYKPMTDVDTLSERELAVLKLVAHGLSNETIAQQLTVTEGTVRVHVSNILGKLHLENRTQAALYALREKLVLLDDPL